VAENKVEIVVKSRNETKEGFRSAKADAEIAGEQAGAGFLSRFGSVLRGGGGSGADGAATGGLMGAFMSAMQALPLIGGAASSPVGAIGVAIATAIAAAMAPALIGALATLGVGGLGLFAAFKFDKNAPFVKSFKDTFDDIGKSVGQTFAPVLNQLAGFFKTLAGPIKQLFSAAEPGFMAFLKALEPSLRTVTGLVTGFVRAFAPFAGSIGKTVGGLLVDIFKGLKNLEPAFAGSTGLVSTFGRVVGVVVKGVSWVLGQFVAFVSDLFHGKWKAALDLAVNDWRTAWNTLKPAFTAFEAWLQPKINAFLVWLGEHLPALAQKIGAALIDGLIKGIEANKWKVLGEAANIASDIIKTFGGLLGIASPSKVFYEHGLNIAKGLELGIRAGSGGPLDAIHRLGAGLSLGGMGGGYGGGGVQIVFHGQGAAQMGWFVKHMWPDMQIEVRHRGGGGPNSVQKALGQTWPGHGAPAA